jgi:FkbM family methyltransferase
VKGLDQSAPWGVAKALAKRLWFRPETVRRCHIGPYAGLSLELSPQVLETRMAVFYRAYEPEVTAWLSDAARPGMVAYDVGAHVGIHALYLGKLLGRAGLVLAFEPWPENFRRLRRNIAYNPALAARVVPIHKAVGLREGTARFTEGSTDGTHHLAGLDEASAMEVPVTTLDSVWDESGRSPDLIVIDVEGAELEVLEGAQRLLAKCRPKLAMEHHGPQRCEQLAQWLTNRGFRIKTIGQRHLVAT